MKNLVVLLAICILAGCSSVDLNKSLQSIGMGTQQGPKTTFPSDLADKKEKNALVGEWSAGYSPNPNPKNRVLTTYTVLNSDGDATVFQKMDKQTCSGKAKARIVSSNVFTLTNSPLKCDDGAERSAHHKECTVNPDSMKATCLAECIGRDDIQVRKCSVTLEKIETIGKSK